MKYWIATVRFKDGTELKTQPFFKYDAGFKVWSAAFSARFKSAIEHITCDKFDSKDDGDVAKAMISFSEECGKRLKREALYFNMVATDMSREIQTLKRKLRNEKIKGQRRSPRGTGRRRTNIPKKGK